MLQKTDSQMYSRFSNRRSRREKLLYFPHSSNISTFIFLLLCSMLTSICLIRCQVDKVHCTRLLFVVAQKKRRELPLTDEILHAKNDRTLLLAVYAGYLIFIDFFLKIFS